MDNFLKENERIDDLQINNLKIIQNKNGFCFGIDSVLLSDFAKGIKDNSKIIDLCTGTGIISILLTAKTKPENIIGVELQRNVADMARRSVIMNGIDSKVDILNENIKNLDKILPLGRYDAIVTNPPYIKVNTGARNINSAKLISRHEVECTLEDIAKISFKLLKSTSLSFLFRNSTKSSPTILYSYIIIPYYTKNKMKKRKNFVIIKLVTLCIQ